MKKNRPLKKPKNRLLEKLSVLPTSPGIYFHKNKNGEIIYIGKAAVLKNRVKQYFQNSRNINTKTKALISDISDIDWIETDSEIDALFLEAEMIKRYMPRYNILLRDDKSLIYIRINIKDEWPFVSFTRNPADDGAEYYGPYINGFAVKKALRYLRRIFPYYIKKSGSKLKKSSSNLDVHLGLSPTGMTSNEYKTNLRQLISYIKGNRKKLISKLEHDMKQAAATQNYEKAAVIRNKLQNLRELKQRIMFSDKEFLDISKDLALKDLTELFNLSKIPVRIEGYDISHTSGTDVVASMIVFKNGISDRTEYRKFKTHIEQNDDTYNMNEIINRRFSQRNLKIWGKPGFVIIDGGKGQLGAAIKARDTNGYNNIPFIGFAKKDEEIYIKSLMLNKNKLNKLGGTCNLSGNFIVVNLPKSSNIIKLLQRICDESHRFAIYYHSSLKRKKLSYSVLDDISGIGVKTKTKLIREFGSLIAIKKASESDIALVVGSNKAQKIKANL